MAGLRSMVDATCDFDELEGLKALATRLAAELDACDEPRLVPQLARQYRETLGRIAVIEGGVDDDDEIAAIILRNRQPAAD
jgi:hypothetical protein